VSRIAVVVPTFNRANFLPSTLEGVQGQSRTDWELLLVNDGSGDPAVKPAQAAANRDMRIHVFSQAHAGIAAARNGGIGKIPASAEYVAFLDDDDVWEPNALAKLAAAIDADPEAVGAYGLARIIDSLGRERPNKLIDSLQTERKGVQGGRLINWPRDAPTTFSVMVYASVIMTPGAALIRRSALDRAGLFREPAADWDMWLRLTMQGHLVFVPEVVINYRLHPGNESRDILRKTRRKLIVHWRLMLSRGLTRAQRRTAWLGFVYYYADVRRLARTFRRLIARLVGTQDGT
jgi:glycosyltransferase involved in cell wall biosynthesis